MALRNPAPGSAAAAPSPATAISGRAEALLRRLEWKVLRRLDGLLQGDYRTLMRGAGIDLAEARRRHGYYALQTPGKG
jgi:hypothetical protein